MATMFETLSSTSWGSLLRTHGQTVSYTASGAAAANVTAIWHVDEGDVVDGDAHETSVRLGVLRVAESDVATVTENEDTITVDGDTWTVTGVDGLSGGVWALRCELTEDTAIGGGTRRRI